MIRIVRVITAIFVGMSSNVVADYPDHYYELAGLLGPIQSDTYMEWGEFKEKEIMDEEFLFGPFWPREQKAVLRIKEIIESLDTEEKRTDRFKVITRDNQSMVIQSAYLKRLVGDFYKQNDYGRLSPTELMFSEANEEQILVYLEGIYLRWGIEGENVIKNPKVPIDRLLELLEPYSHDLVTLRTHLLVPNSIEIVFIPGVELGKRLDIDNFYEFKIVRRADFSK